MRHQIINVGLIGLGRIGKMHAKNICEKLPLLNLKSIADPKPDLEFIQNLGGTTLHEDAQEIISDKNIDAIIISSPTPTHFNLIKKCLRNNKHVFCEKPISFSETINMFSAKSLFLFQKMK